MSKVYIIDDDPIHQRIAQIMIDKNDLFEQHTSFTEAEKALEMIKQNTRTPENLPDVILLDLNMPVMTGWDFLDGYETVREDIAKPIKIFIVTSSVDEKDRSRSKTYSSVVGFISKPLSPEVIRSTI